MFDVGFTELLMIGIIALVVLGPERLPQAVRRVGLWIGKAKKGFNAVKTEIDRELKVQELQQQIEAQKQALKDALPLEDLKQDLQQMKSSANAFAADAEQNILPPIEQAANALKPSPEKPEDSTPKRS